MKIEKADIKYLKKYDDTKQAKNKKNCEKKEKKASKKKSKLPPGQVIMCAITLDNT